MEELGQPAFEGVADKLKNPAGGKHHQRGNPEDRQKETDGGKNERNNNQGNTDRMTGAINRMPVTVTVLLDPLIPVFAAECVTH